MSYTYDNLVQNKLELMRVFACANVHMVPKLTKVVLSCGLNSERTNQAVAKQVRTDMSLISALKPISVLAKKSIAGFKVREAQLIGLKVTLRSMHMFEFLDRLIHIALPRIREFRGLDANSFDAHRNISFGIKEYSVFPEVKYNKSTRLLGVNITLCTSASTKADAIKLLTFMGFPFKGVV
ncbi:50S ribosomal protein L5 [Candidatus Hodgkinia cicadicola]